MTPDTPLRPLVRAFLDRTPYSQEDLARQADVSLKTVNNVVAGRTSWSPETETKLREAMSRLQDLEEIGGFDLSVRVATLEDRVEHLQGLLDEIAAQIGATRSPPQS